MKKISYILEAMIAHLALFIFGIFSFTTTSNIGSWLGRFIGPKLKVHKLAKRNIKRAMPQLNKDQVDAILTGMWDNLGRTMLEYSHISKLKSDDFAKMIIIENEEYLDAMKKDSGCIMMTGHFANWEILASFVYYKECPLHIVYRQANNPYVNQIIYDIRSNYQASSSAKGTVGARQIIKALQKGSHITMLVDQKQNDGIASEFFGDKVMTAPAIATLSRKYNANIYPSVIRRIDNCKFKVTFGAPFKAYKTDNAKDDILKSMNRINKIIEDWIKEDPKQWFWVHNRWPKRKINFYNQRLY